MSLIEFDYTIDAGALGMLSVHVRAKAERVFATETLVSICSIHAPTLVHGEGDLRIEALSPRTLDAIRGVAFSEHLRGRIAKARPEGSSETGVPA